MAIVFVFGFDVAIDLNDNGPPLPFSQCVAPPFIVFEMAFEWWKNFVFILVVCEMEMCVCVSVRHLFLLCTEKVAKEAKCIQCESRRQYSNCSLFLFFLVWKSCAFNWRQMVRFNFLLSPAVPCAQVKAFLRFTKLVNWLRNPYVTKETRFDGKGEQTVVRSLGTATMTYDRNAKERIIMLKWFRVMENAMQINNYQSERSPASSQRCPKTSSFMVCAVGTVQCTGNKPFSPFHFLSFFFPAALKFTQMWCSLRMKVRSTLPVERSPGNDVRVSTVLCGGLKIRLRFLQIHRHSVSAYTRTAFCALRICHFQHLIIMCHALRQIFISECGDASLPSPNRNEFESKEDMAHSAWTHTHTHTYRMKWIGEWKWNEASQALTHSSSVQYTLMPCILLHNFMTTRRSHWDSETDTRNDPKTSAFIESLRKSCLLHQVRLYWFDRVMPTAGSGKPYRNAFNRNNYIEHWTRPIRKYARNNTHMHSSKLE